MHYRSAAHHGLVDRSHSIGCTDRGHSNWHKLPAEIETVDLGQEPDLRRVLDFDFGLDDSEAG